MSFLKTLLLIAICSIHGYCQVSFSGQVTDLKKGQPVPFAHVILDKTSWGTQTDENGNFEIKGIKEGNYNATISSIGFTKKSIKLNLNTSHFNYKIELAEDASELDEIYVTAKSTETKIETKGFAVNAIETKDIKFQSVQAMDLLDQSAGVRIRQSGGQGSRVVYNINGLSGSSIRIFIDGVPIENFGPSFSLSSLPTNLIERIEVYKGVVPAELATDALGGAINIILNEEAKNMMNVAYSVGSFNTHNASLNTSLRNKKTGITLNASGFYNYSDNNYDVWGNQIYITNKFGKIDYITAERFHDSYQSYGSKIDLGVSDKKWADKAYVGMVVSDLDKDVQHGATMESVYAYRRAYQSTRMFNATYKKDGFLFKNLDISLFGSKSNLKRKVVDTVAYITNWYGELSDFNEDGKWEEWSSGAEAGVPTLNEDIESTISLKASGIYNFNAGNRLVFNFLRTGFQRKPDDPLKPLAERELIDTRYLTKDVYGLAIENSFFTDKLKSSLFYKFYNQNVSLKDAVRASRGGAVTAYEYDKTTTKNGYGLAVSFQLIRKLQIMTSLENAIRLPTGQEVFGNTAENINPSYQLNPESSQNLNVGLNIGPFRTSGHTFKLMSNVFFRDTKGMIRQAVANQQDETFSFENQDAVLSRGVDSELNYSYIEKLFLKLGVSLFNARFNKQFDANGSQYIYFGDRLRNEPYFTLNNNTRYNLNDLILKGSRVSIYHNLSYVHQFFRDWESLGSAGKDIIPTQLVNDLGFAFTLPNNKITISFDAKNIFNEQVFDNYALQKAGRAFYTKLNYNIF
ncbi:Outer membrane receptor proteins, mostly Fe transport [Spirosomataceae bacterium TFI 002]|nr:Outer membrane receptor proteins, mostly Fe transport [Spirosomataceae bacterium TFI 002]